MLDLRRTSRWWPLAAVVALLAVTALVQGPTPLLRLAARAARAPLALHDLPADAAWSLLRILGAYLASLAFSWVVAHRAAHDPRAARVLLPLLDIGQSVPVLGFFPAAIFLFITLLGGGRLALELAAMFLVFTSVAWNIAFGIYESLCTIPRDLRDALNSLGVRGWLALKRLEIPACVPRVLSNSIVSWSNAWYFLIASEIITAGPVNYSLPGLGSLLSESLAHGQLGLAGSALATIVAIVVAVDFLVWRPLLRWGDRFHYQHGVPVEEAPPGALGAVLPNLALPVVVRAARALGWLVRSIPVGAIAAAYHRGQPWLRRAAPVLRWVAVIAAAALGVAALVSTVRAFLRPWPAEARLLPAAVGLSALRILVAYLLSLAWVIPLALRASGRPRLLDRLSLIAQVGASIPATAFFPVLVALLVDRFGGMEVIAVLLALTGMQWYLLFNVLSGVRSIPSDLHESLRALGLSRREIHRKLVLPAALPSIVTGSVAGWGGCWNSLILSEYVVFRGHSYSVLGLGALLNQATYVSGSGSLLLLSVTTMVVVVVLINRFLWQPVYQHVNERYRLEST